MNLPSMKRPLVLVAVALCMFSAAKAQVPIGPNDVVIDRVLPSVVKTPEYAISGPAKRFRNQDWLEVEVEFTTRPELIAELTFRFSILISGKLLVSDDVTYINIPKGREHYAVAYVAPRSLARVNEGRPLTGASIENIKVDITHQGQLLASKSLKPTPLPNVQQITGLVLKKPDTPFAPLYWDRYEALKAQGR
jgi:hypothetical protein